MVWYVAVFIETVFCLWVQLERRTMGRHSHAGPPPLHRVYGRLLARIGYSYRHRRPKLEKQEARRRTGLVTFTLTTLAMVPMLLLVLLNGLHMSPAEAQLVTWPTLWLAPVLTFAPAKLVSLLVAVWRGWLRLDDGDGGPMAAVPVPGSGPGSHDYLLPR